MQRNYGPNANNVCVANDMLGLFYERRGDYSAAGYFFVDELRIYSKMYNPEHPFVMEARARVARVVAAVEAAASAAAAAAASAEAVEAAQEAAAASAGEALGEQGTEVITKSTTTFNGSVEE